MAVMRDRSCTHQAVPQGPAVPLARVRSYLRTFMHMHRICNDACERGACWSCWHRYRYPNMLWLRCLHKHHCGTATSPHKPCAGLMKFAYLHLTLTPCR